MTLLQFLVSLSLAFGALKLCKLCGFEYFERAPVVDFRRYAWFFGLGSFAQVFKKLAFVGSRAPLLDIVFKADDGILAENVLFMFVQSTRPLL